MDLGGITNNIGAIIGGVVVIVVAYFLFKPRSNKDLLETSSKDIVSKAGKENETEKLDTPPSEPVSTNQISPVWKTRRYLLKKIRSLKKPDVLMVKHHENTKQAVDSHKEKISPPVNLPVADLSGVPVEPLEENQDNILNVEESYKDTPEIPVDASIDDTISISGEIEKTDGHESSDNDDSPESDMTSQPLVDETTADNAQLEVNVTNHEQLLKKTERGGNVFDLFTEEDEEENETSKFASKLDQVDVKNLLTQAENIQKYIRR
ncbi:MAG: hypothetical protein JSU58_00565 [Dehalococcoidales bacterium]|nr:MAG: hypothetical protein JSU58_00565 [Dehalococcoidales bacterium]